MPLSVNNGGQVARAWVNFNGALSGTITPRGSFNVTSVTKNSTGNYTVNWPSLPDANYEFQITLGNASGAVVVVYQVIAKTASSIQFLVANTVPAPADVTEINLSIRR